MRKLGVLLHITSLYGKDLIGTLGEASFDMLERLHKANLSIWQMLPVCPVGYGASPYASPSLFAGNVLLIDAEELVRRGFIDEELCTSYFRQIEQHKNGAVLNRACSANLSSNTIDIDISDFEKLGCGCFASEKFASNEGFLHLSLLSSAVDYKALDQHKIPFLHNCALQFLKKIKRDESLRNEYLAFCKEESVWLEDYANFSYLEKQGFTVKDIIKMVKNGKIALACIDGGERKEVEKVLQFFFFKQWKVFKAKAEEKSILLFGDLPMFPSYHSCDVAFNSEYFCLDEEGEPTLVAGVPPDYFSAEGQLWGNPVYDWQKMETNHYEWWCNRIKHSLKLFDYVRLDHFRGFESFWGVTYGEKTAKNGKWVKAGGHRFFCVLKETLGYEQLPFVAEDLGIITDEVRVLKDAFHLKGMNVLHFAFNPSEYKSENVVSSYLPHNVDENSVIYTGTHDNNTTLGWLAEMQRDERQFVSEYVGAKRDASDEEVGRALIRLALFSRSEWAIIPMQDFCLLDGSARMNTPSTTQGNWEWRMSEEMFADAKAKEIANLAVLFTRYRRT